MGERNSVGLVPILLSLCFFGGMSWSSSSDQNEGKREAVASFQPLGGRWAQYFEAAFLKIFVFLCAVTGGGDMVPLADRAAYQPWCGMRSTWIPPASGPNRRVLCPPPHPRHRSRPCPLSLSLSLSPSLRHVCVCAV